MPQLQCEEIRFPSADGVHTVAASMYTMPGVPVRAVLQLSHGMYENSLNVHIRHLREKLEPNPSKPQYLLTVRGIGYKLAEENAQ